MLSPLIASLRPEIHGHRGCRGLLPENTLPAFLHALELGVDALEMDVVLSADGEVVVSHEPWLTTRCCDAQGNPIAPGTEQQHNLYRMSYAEIRCCDCGSLFHPGFPFQQLQPAYKPLLAEVIALVESSAEKLGRSPIRYSVEVKSSPVGDNLFHPSPEIYVARVLAVLLAAQLLPRVTLLSFDKRILQAVRQQSPALALCLLVEDEKPCEKHLQELGFRPEVYGPLHTLVTPAMVADLHRQHIQLVAWTVNTMRDAQRLSRLGVDGLTTDYPDVLLAQLPCY